MTREKAIEVFDRLVAMGYSVTLAGRDLVNYIDADGQSIRYSVHVNEISVDTVDVKALVEVADDLGLDVGWSPVRGQGFSFGDPQERRPEAVTGPRRHPRPVKN